MATIEADAVRGNERADGAESKISVNVEKIGGVGGGMTVKSFGNSSPCIRDKGGILAVKT